MSLSLGKKDYLEGYLHSKAEKLRATAPTRGSEDTVSPTEQCSFIDCKLITAEGCVGNQHVRKESVHLSLL